MQNNHTLAVKPIIKYPHIAQVGTTYLIKIDLLPEENSVWPSDIEEYPIHCVVSSETFASRCIGEPIIVLHKFGGTYGEAKFLIKTLSTEKQGSIEISLLNYWGVLVKSIQISKILITSDILDQPVEDFIITRVTKPGTIWEENDSFLQQLTSLSQSLFNSVVSGVRGNRGDRELDLITDQLINRTRGFEQKYLLCQAAECQAYRTEGINQFDGVFIPLLKEVFVPLALDSSSMRTLMPPNDISEQQGEVSIWDILAKVRETPAFRQIAILAWGGYGKTTLLRHIAFRYGTQQAPKNAPKLVPILLFLRQYRELFSRENPPDLVDFIIQYHLPNLPNGDVLHPNQNWAINLLRNGKALVMLDGFDELARSERSQVSRWLTTQMRLYNQSIFLLTSRPKAYKEQDAATRLQLSTNLWVRDFDIDQSRQFVYKWYECQERYKNLGRKDSKNQALVAQAAESLITQIDLRPELRDLSRTPLLLNMVLTFHRTIPGGGLPKQRVRLYQGIIRLQLVDRPNAKRISTLITQINTQEILQEIAFLMMVQHRVRINRQDLIKQLNRIIQNQDEVFTSARFISELTEISELILLKDENEYAFANLIFQEYLASAHIKETQQEQILYSHFHDDWWKPTIVLYSAQVNPTQLIQAALRDKAEDLAYACLQESTDKVDPNLVSELNKSRQQRLERPYAPLNNYLKAGDWKSADNETYRLMITSVGKKIGQYFQQEELLNFPCETLSKIDALWVKHSSGKFGFSVQEKIYSESCQSKWNSFVNAVGWQEKHGRLKLKFSFEAPTGHLPFLAVFGDDINDISPSGEALDYGGDREFIHIFSRIRQCRQ